MQPPCGGSSCLRAAAGVRFCWLAGDVGVPVSPHWSSSEAAPSASAPLAVSNTFGLAGAGEEAGITGLGACAKERAVLAERRASILLIVLAIHCNFCSRVAASSRPVLSDMLGFGKQSAFV